MRLIDIVIMALIPASIGCALLMAAVSGRLSSQARARIQRALIFVVYPVSVLFFAWQALFFAGSGSWVRALVFVGGAVVMAVAGLRLLRRQASRDDQELAL